MNDVMENVKIYLSSGNALLRGKRLLVYLCLFIITVAGMLPSVIKIALDPDVSTLLPSMAKSVYELTETYSTDNGRRSAKDEEFKSEGQLLAEKLQAEREASKKAAMQYLGVFIDWLYEFLIGGILTVGMCSIYLRLAKREVGIKDLFSGFTSGNYLNKVIALLLKSGILMVFSALELLFTIFGLWIVALAVWIGSIVVSYALFMVEFILADDPNISFLRAIQISFKASSGYKASLFVIDLLTSILPSALAWFGVIALLLSSIRDGDFSRIYQALALVFGVALFLMLIKPIRDGAFAAAYEDAKISGKNYGYISQFEFYDPEDQIDNTDDSGMMFFG